MNNTQYPDPTYSHSLTPTKVAIPIKIDFAWNLAQKIGSGLSFKN